MVHRDQKARRRLTICKSKCSFSKSENLNCLLFRSLSPCVYFLFEQMQVFHTHYFGRTFPSQPFSWLTPVYIFYIIDSRQVDAVSAPSTAQLISIDESS